MFQTSWGFIDVFIWAHILKVPKASQGFPPAWKQDCSNRWNTWRICCDCSSCKARGAPLRNLSSKTYLYKVAMEERRKRQKEQPNFPTKTHCEGFLPGSIHMGHFPCSLFISGRQLGASSTFSNYTKLICTLKCAKLFWPSCCIFRRWLLVVASWAKSKIELKPLMLGDAPPGGSFCTFFCTFWYVLGTESARHCPQKSHWVMDLLGQMPPMQTMEKKSSAAIHILVQITRKRNTKKPNEKKKIESWVPVLTVCPLNSLQLSKPIFQHF